MQTGKAYRGGNSVWLMSVAEQRGYDDHRWGTYNQVKGLGGLLTICQGQKSYKKGQLLPVDLARLNQGKNPSHSQNGS